MIFEFRLFQLFISDFQRFGKLICYKFGIFFDRLSNKYTIVAKWDPTILMHVKRHATEMNTNYTISNSLLQETNFCWNLGNHANARQMQDI